MKISASIYSDKRKDWEQSIEDMHKHNADMIHVDCNDDPEVLEDIKKFKSKSDLPIDLHLITAFPEKYLDTLQALDVDLITLQYESLQEPPIDFLKSIKAKKGLAITSDTPISVFDEFADLYDFILFMATVPGQSGGKFDAKNFAKIRAFQAKYPHKKVHVDGGVNAEVSFILRNMGVYASVSGSYLFNADSMGAAMLNLKNNEVASHYKVEDIMRTPDETPSVNENASFKEVLQSIEDGNMGVTMVVSEDDTLKGIISNADVRKTLLHRFPDVQHIKVVEMINPNPVLINDQSTVEDMLRHIKKQAFPIMYMPVVDNNYKLSGSLAFMNLIKGEL